MGKQQNSKKTGSSMNGKMENINRVKSVKCNCRSCYHSKKAAGAIYCKYYDRINPQKTRCVRYTQKENYGPRRPATESIMSTYQPTFPWEMP